MFNVNDENFKNSATYKKFINEHPALGSLRIKASAASGAVPISGVKIVVTTMIENVNVVFFEGETDNSGLIEKINLPAYKLDTNNLEVPNKTVYSVKATYVPDNLSMTFNVNIYENINVVQNINIVPELRLIEGDTIVS